MLFDFICLCVHTFSSLVPLCVCVCVWETHTWTFFGNVEKYETRLASVGKVTSAKQTGWQERSLLILPPPSPFKCGPTKKRGGKRRKNKRTGKIGVVSLYLSCPKLLLSAAGLGGCFCRQSAADFSAAPLLCLGLCVRTAPGFGGLKWKKCLYYTHTLKNIDTLNRKDLSQRPIHLSCTCFWPHILLFTVAI